MVLEVLHPLVAPRESPDLTVDIVAIHGLNGGATHTWTNPTTGAFWLRDFLMLDVLGARVMSFGYNATAAFGNSMSDFEDHARDLLTSLVDKRQKDDEIQRPLIFIAHSLGGIIVKQALILARVDPKHRSIHSHTVGIAFLGTPHWGSEIAGYGNILAQVATFAAGKPGPSLTAALKRNSTELLKLTSEFRFEWNKFKVVSFYERKPTGVGRMATVIVEKHSALLQFEGEDQIPVDTDHRGICRFASRDDPTYDKLFRRLNRMVDESAGSKAPSLRAIQGTSVDSGWTPLHRAAHDGVSAELRRLLRLGADVDAEDDKGMTPLHLAAGAGHDTIIYILLGKDASVKRDDLGRTALHCAAENGQVAAVRELLVQGLDVGTKDQSGKTAMDSALENQHEAVVWLLEHGHELTAKDKNGDTMLIWAVTMGHEAVVQLLLNKGAKATERDSESGATALHYAASQGKKAIVRLLLKNKAEIDTQNRCGATALHSAATNGYLPVVQLLIDEGADINTVDSLGRTPLDIALSSEHEAVAQLLKAAQKQYDEGEARASLSISRLGRSPTSTTRPTRRNNGSRDTSHSPSEEFRFSRASTAFDPEERNSKDMLSSPLSRSTGSRSRRTTRANSGELFEAVKAGKYLVVEELACDGKVDLNAVDTHGATALHMASQRGDNDMVHFLVDRGADVNARDRSGTTALHMASKGGHEDVTLALLNAGADVKAKAANKQTSLHMASEYGHEATVRLLFDYGANMDARDEGGWTALALAASRGNEEVVGFLAANRAELDTGQVGETALHVAAHSGHERVVRLLLESEININTQSKGGLTALHMASSRGMEIVVRLLLEKGADFETRTEKGFTAIHLAAENGHEPVTRLLAKNSTTIETPCGDLGATALHYAAMSGNEAVVRALLDSGASHNSRCKKGATALHYAAFSGQEATVRLLLERGADVMAETTSGRLASHWASRPEHKHVERLLKEKEKEKQGRRWMGFRRRATTKT